MGKGTAAFGKHNKAATHMICRRCGNHSYFKRKAFCSSCGFGRISRLRHYNWYVKIAAFYGNKRKNVKNQEF